MYAKRRNKVLTKPFLAMMFPSRAVIVVFVLSVAVIYKQYLQPTQLPVVVTNANASYDFIIGKCILITLLYCLLW